MSSYSIEPIEKNNNKKIKLLSNNVLQTERFEQVRGFVFPILLRQN